MRGRFMPFQQGELDNLCGLYCIVNAVVVAVRRRPASASNEMPLRLRRFDDKNADQLFDDLVRTADRCTGLRSVLLQGIKTPVFGRLLGSADRHLCVRHSTRLCWSKPYHKQKAVEPVALKRRLQRHLGAAHTAAIIAYQEHWSVVEAVTSKRLVLADSSSDSWLVTGRRARTKHGIHIREVWPTSIFLIRLAAVPVVSLPVIPNSAAKVVSKATASSVRSSSVSRRSSAQVSHSAGSP